MYWFIFGCAGCLLLRELFSSCTSRGCCLVTGYLGFSLQSLLSLQRTGSRAGGLQYFQLPGSRAQAEQLWCRAWLPSGTWDLPGPGIAPVSPALAGEFFTMEPPVKPGALCFYLSSAVFLTVTLWGHCVVILLTQMRKLKGRVLAVAQGLRATDWQKQRVNPGRSPPKPGRLPALLSAADSADHAPASPGGYWTWPPPGGWFSRLAGEFAGSSAKWKCGPLFLKYSAF